MSDQTPDPHDDLLREALHATAEGITADAELLARIQAATSTRPAYRRVTPWLLAAALCALVVGVGATLLTDDDTVVDTLDDPSTTTTSTTTSTTDMFDVLSHAFPCEGDSGFQTVIYLASSATAEEVDAVGTALGADPRVQSTRSIPPTEVAAALEAAAPEAEWNPASIPSGYLTTSLTSEDDLAVRGAVSDLPSVRATSSTACTGTTTPDPGRPSLVALVREDGMLVAIDLTTGEERELYAEGDPNGPGATEEGGSNYIDSVEMSPSGEWIYFSTCCEPAGGNTYRIATTGGEPELVAVGSYPRLSPDGRYVATGSTSVLIVTPVDPVRSGLAFSYALQGWYVASLAWSPDGTQLAYVADGEVTGEVRQVDLLSFDGATLNPADMGKPDNPGAFASWAPDGTLTISSGGPIDDDRALSQDRSYHWMLWVDEAGVVREQAHQSGDRTPLPGLPKAIAADW